MGARSREVPAWGSQVSGSSMSPVYRRLHPSSTRTARSDDVPEERVADSGLRVAVVGSIFVPALVLARLASYYRTRTW